MRAADSTPSTTVLSGRVSARTTTSSWTFPGIELDIELALLSDLQRHRFGAPGCESTQRHLDGRNRPEAAVGIVKRPRSSLVAVHVLDVASERTLTDAPGVAASCVSTIRPASVATAGCAATTNGTKDTKSTERTKRAMFINDESSDRHVAGPRQADRRASATTA
jgi:hypothetical protein